MNNESLPTTNLETTPNTRRRTCCIRLSALFSNICNFMEKVFRPGLSVLQLENAALREQLESGKMAMEKENRRGEELELLKSSLNETVMALQSESEKIKSELVLREHEVCRCKTQILEQKEHFKRLEKEIDETEDLNHAFETIMKAREDLSAEWVRMIDNREKETRSLEKQLQRKCDSETKNVWHLTALDTGFEHFQGVSNELRSEKEKLESSCTQLKRENRLLRENLKNLKSKKRHAASPARAAEQ